MSLGPGSYVVAQLIQGQGHAGCNEQIGFLVFDLVPDVSVLFCVLVAKYGDCFVYQVSCWSFAIAFVAAKDGNLMQLQFLKPSFVRSR